MWRDIGGDGGSRGMVVKMNDGCSSGRMVDAEGVVVTGVVVVMFESW